MSVRLRAVLWLALIGVGAALAWSRWPLNFPVSCLFRRVTGIECPSCGMTRATCALAHGQFLEAEQFNLAAIPLAAFGCVLALLLVREAITNRPSVGPFWKRIKRFAVWGIVLLLVVAWCGHFIPH